jgi:hypothetical protein
MTGKLKMCTVVAHAEENKPVAIQSSCTWDCLVLFNGKGIICRFLRHVWQAEYDDFLRSENKFWH